MKFLNILVTLALCAHQIQALYLNDGSSEDGGSGAKGCEEQICARIYNPICVAVDGEPTTMVSKCHVANLRCQIIKYAVENKGAPVPRLRILYGGECD